MQFQITTLVTIECSEFFLCSTYRSKTILKSFPMHIAICPSNIRVGIGTQVIIESQLYIPICSTYILTSIKILFYSLPTKWSCYRNPSIQLSEDFLQQLPHSPNIHYISSNIFFSIEFIAELQNRKQVMQNGLNLMVQGFFQLMVGRFPPKMACIFNNLVN